MTNEPDHAFTTVGKYLSYVSLSDDGRSISINGESDPVLLPRGFFRLDKPRKRSYCEKQ